MTEFTVGDNTYSCQKMDARKQFHLLRRLVGSGGPIVKALVDTGYFKPSTTLDPVDDGSKLMSVLPAFMEAISKLQDEDADYILDGCLVTVQRKDSGGWQKITTEQGKLFYPDIDMPTQLVIAFHVIKDNLSNFLDALQRAAMAPVLLKE